MSPARKAKRHSQRGMSMGVCPNCMRDMWQGQPTVVTPVRKPEGGFDAVLAHSTCPSPEGNVDG